MHPPRPRPQDRRSGFALLITITLVAFLVLILVSLAALTRVETQVASNSQHLNQARQNALMALNIALGRLQALAGPDQRITATAEIIPGAHDDKRRWTGVWDTTAASPAPEWLVSTAAATPPQGTVSVTTSLQATGTAALVGSNSVDTTDAGNAVMVETQPIKSDAVPGLAGTGHTMGNFAWWVGDEGVKAKVSLTDPWVGAGTPEEEAYRLRVAQRFGIELVESTAGAPLLANYPANDEGLKRVLDLKQLPMASLAGQPALASAIKKRFHDLTAASWSVLADVAQGGLKKDLTSWLAHASPASGAPTDSDFMAPLASGDASGIAMPRWGLLRSYAGLSGGTAPLPPRVQTDQQNGFHPLISYFRVAFGVSCSGDDQPLVAHMFPVLVLWNPYDTPIAAASYEFVFGIRNNADNIIFRAGSSGGPIKGRLLLSSSPWLSSGPDTNSPDGSQTSRRYTRLAIDSPVIGPGQSIVFTLNNSGWYHVPGSANSIPMSDNDPPAIDNSLYFSLPAITLTAVERNGGAGIINIRLSGGEFDMGLYPSQPPTPNPTVAEWRQITPYHLVQHFGLTSRTQDVAIPDDPLDAVPGPHYWKRLPITNALNDQWYRNARWLANLNPRAPLHLAAPGSSLRQVYLNDSNNNSPAPDIFDGNQSSAGYFTSPIPARPLVISELASGSVHNEARLLSLAQLQHVNFSQLAQTPSYAVGNSEVSYLVGRTATAVSLSPNSTVVAPANAMNRVYDLSYLLNRELWDRYYFSSIPQSLTDTQVADASFHLPNARHGFYRGKGPPTAASLTEAAAFHTSSARLLLNGGFNVNSTSEQAWRALLASHHAVDTSLSGFSHAFSRFSDTRAGDSANQPRASGYRLLSDDQLTELARNIVAEVRARGPFLSLADFINRRLADDTTGLKGPLQAAIDRTDTSTVTTARINDPFNDPASYIGTQSYFPNKDATLEEKKNHLASDEDPSVARTRPSASRAAFMPGFLTQADLLNSLGPVLAARSDTFVIRAYGDVQNPATQVIEGKAWCEAVVQRLPDYVNDSMPAETDLAAAPASVAKTTNLAFGRRFEIVSFRWLTAADL